MSTPKRRAVVVGATNGIGKAISCRLAADGFDIIAVGRDKEGRKEAVVNHLIECSSKNSASQQKKKCHHEFRPCDAFSLSQVKECAESIVRDYSTNGGIDALVMTQGMATIQGFTPTTEGNDEKLTLHLWSRAAFAASLLPALRSSSSMPGGAVVMTVLSGGVHSPYTKYAKDPEIRNNYSIKNAADGAGYYTDLFFDKLARQNDNKGINFIHSAPGFVASNWGTEMPMYLRGPIRFMQKLGGKSPENNDDGLFIMKEDASSGKFTELHNEEAMESVWNTTKTVLGRAGIVLDD